MAATYPEKHVYDVAGFPKILGQKLVDMCAEQGLQYGADVRLGEEAKTLERVSENGEELLALTTDKGNTYLSRAMIITAGHGAFEPRGSGSTASTSGSAAASTTSSARRRSSPASAA